MLSTDILIDFINRQPNYERIAKRMSGCSPGELRLSAVTLSELRFAIENREFRTDHERALKELPELLQADNLPCAAAQDFAAIKSALLAKGTSIGAYDMLIAAHARQLSATVVTNNEQEFRRVPGLRVANWLKP